MVKFSNRPDSAVGYCNIFTGTGIWDPKAADLLLFNHSWDPNKHTGTSPYYLDGAATLRDDGTWAGPLQKIGRDAKAGDQVQIAAVLVDRPWSTYLLSENTDASDQAWSTAALPPGEPAITTIVTRTGDTQHGCTKPAN